MTKPRQTNYLALISGFVLAATIYSLLDLHRASTDRKEGEDAHQRFATEFKVVSKSLGQAVKRAWRQHSTTNVDLPSPSSSKRLPEDIYDEPPPAEKLGQCIIYRNTNLHGEALNDGSNTRVDSAGESLSAFEPSWPIWQYTLSEKHLPTLLPLGKCCDLCSEANQTTPSRSPCNLWVFCGDKEKCGNAYGQCWLKRLGNVNIVSPQKLVSPWQVNQHKVWTDSNGRVLPWTSGTLAANLDLTATLHPWRLQKEAQDQERKAKEEDAIKLAASDAGVASGPVYEVIGDPAALTDTYVRRIKRGVKTPQTFHSITTAQGAPNHWQARIHYFHWLKNKNLCEKNAKEGLGLCEMGGFTRLLHAGRPDNLMDQIPTTIAEPMPSSLLEHGDYVVLNRPYALAMWVKTTKIPERYVVMLEPDHILLRPLPNFMQGERPAAYDFAYMVPTDGGNRERIKRLLGITNNIDVEKVFPIGNSPTFMSMDDMRQVMPAFLNTSMMVFRDQEAKKGWGWIQEMFAFSMSMYVAGVREVDLVPHMMAHTPYDSQLELYPGRPFHILHYTYGLDFNQTTGEVLFYTVGDWHLCKRDHYDKPMRRAIVPPAATVHFPLGRILVKSFNEATSSIPCWSVYESSRMANVTLQC